MEGRAAIHRDLDRLEKGANPYLVKFNKDKREVLQLGWNKPTQQHRLGANWLCSSLAEKDLGVLVDKLNVSHCRKGVLLRANHILAGISKSTASSSSAYSPLFSTCEVTSGYCIQFQGPHNAREMSTNWRQSRATTTAEEQGHTTDKERLRELGLLSLENEKTKEGSNGSLPLPKELGGRGATKKMEPDLSQRCTVKSKKREYSVQCSKGNSDWK